MIAYFLFEFGYIARVKCFYLSLSGHDAKIKRELGFYDVSEILSLDNNEHALLLFVSWGDISILLQSNDFTDSSLW